MVCKNWTIIQSHYLMQDYNLVAESMFFTNLGFWVTVDTTRIVIISMWGISRKKHRKLDLELYCKLLAQRHTSRPVLPMPT